MERLFEPLQRARQSVRRPSLKVQLSSNIALAASLRRREEGSLQVGMLVALGLMVSAAGVVWVLQGGKLGRLTASEANNAQAVAEAGADLIIGVWNEPENRRLLVAGDAAPSTWTASNQTSPCLSSTNTRPGSNSGNPSADARNLVDGSFRNIDDITQTGTGDRRFRLKAVRYSTGAPGSTDRRTISRTYNTASSTPTTTAGTYSATNFRDLINLDDPDGSGALTAGVNTGYIAVEVESQVYRNGALISTATVTKEYQVLPKCCGASLGSNNSGGTSFSGSSGSLGSDSRYCGVDFGMIVGLNGGKFWSYYANDTYKTINPSTGTEINISSILGLVTNASYKFERNIASADSNNGCRVIPGPCSTSSDVYTTSGTSDRTLYASINCAQCGTASDKAGNSASGIPIIPLFINGGLPSVNTRFGYTWTSGGRPATNFASGGTFGPTITSTATTTTFRIRTRNDTSPPRVEFCDGTYPTVSTTSNNCTSASPRNSWAQISLPSGTATGTHTIGDDFASNSFSGTTSGSVNRWPDIWVETDPSGGAQATNAGNVTINGATSAAVLRLSGPSSSTNTAVRRVVNLHALRDPQLSFTYTRSTLSGAKDLIVEYSTDNGSTYNSLATIARTQATPSTLRYALPAGAQTGFTTLRFRLASNFASSSEWVAIDNVNITNSSGGAVSIDNWCEYSSTRPNTAQFLGGFHCLGPLLQMANGGRFIVDTSGGNLNFYYNSTSDARGTSLASPLINMAAGAELLHVNCPNSGTLTAPPNPTGATVNPSNNCLTGVPSTVYAAVGENDLFNIFGRDSSPSGTAMQWVRIGSTSSSPGKISGAFFYMPWGAVYMIADGCDGTGAVPTTYNFNGRVWSRYLIACGYNYLLTPPSSTLNLSALGINSNINLNTTGFVGWTGTDWQATTSTATRINSSL